MMLGSFTTYIFWNVNFQPNQVYGQSHALNLMCASFFLLLAAFQIEIFELIRLFLKATVIAMSPCRTDFPEISLYTFSLL